MGRWLMRVERALRIEYILYAFWSMFWFLNGLDKFLVPERIEIAGRKVIRGWYGTAHREEQIIEYFQRLKLPEELALFTLYSISVVEMIIGAVFAYILVVRRAPKVIHRMAFKASMAVFFLFCLGDILFGDRKELWEHGTFMVLALVTWSQYVDRHSVRQEVLAEVGVEVQAGEDVEVGLSTQAFDDELARKLAERYQKDKGDS